MSENKQVADLANMFVSILRDWLTEDEMTQLHELNAAETDPPGCATLNAKKAIMRRKTMLTYPRILNVYRRDDSNRLTEEFSAPEFGYLLDAPWEATEKLDGTNIRLIIDDTGAFKVLGRSDYAQLPPQLYEHCAALETRIRRAFDVMTEVCLYGEGVGPRIQKGGGRYGATQHFRLFDVKVGRWWLTREQVQEIGDGLGIPVAPFIGTMTLGSAISMWRDWPEPPRSRIFDGVPEGWVLRPSGDLLFRSGDPIRVKLKDRDFGPLRAGGAKEMM